MKYCFKCGAATEDGAAFCGRCGTAFTAREYDRAVQEECLHTLYHRLCNERRCWKIFGIVFLVLTVILSLCGIALMGIGGAEAESELVIFAGLGAFYFFYSLFMLPIVIIHFVVMRKLDRYISTYYIDVGDTVKRCGEPGAIVLGALCNNIALIFIIINFVYIKRNRAVFNEIMRNQRTA